MNTNPRIDWGQFLYPGRRRPFSADEMARAGNDPPSPTLVAIVTANAALLGFVTLQLSPPQHTARLTGILVALAFMGMALGRWLWWRPWRRPLLLATVLVVVVTGALAFGLKWRLPQREDRVGLAVVVGGAGALLPLLLWFLALWRAQQIEGRLAAQAEREKAIEMARRLASAQIEPHFLFNTLASLQHWVQTKDDRAAPLLAALTGYLRATLPLFNRSLLPVADELVAVRRYLEVMQARMGERLAWSLALPPALEQALLPPGLLLTLVENAVVHGAEPQLHGARIELRGWLDGGQALFEVRDSGPGPAPGSEPGVGLANLRQRLTLAYGDAARFSLRAAPEGGALARIELPFRTEQP
jgi:signal transduction histidine kinase